MGHLITYAQEGKFNAISCKFHGDAANRGYTYKARKALDFSVGDLAVVKTKGNIPFKVVEVVAIDVDIDYYADFEYKWIVDKIYTTDFEQMLEAEEALVKELKSNEMQVKLEAELQNTSITDAKSRWDF